MTSAKPGEILVYSIGKIGKVREKEALVIATKQSLFLAVEIDNF